MRPESMPAGLVRALARTRDIQLVGRPGARRTIPAEPLSPALGFIVSRGRLTKSPAALAADLLADPSIAAALTADTRALLRWVATFGDHVDPGGSSTFEPQQGAAAHG